MAFLMARDTGPQTSPDLGYAGKGVGQMASGGGTSISAEDLAKLLLSGGLKEDALAALTNLSAQCLQDPCKMSLPEHAHETLQQHDANFNGVADAQTSTAGAVLRGDEAEKECSAVLQCVMDDVLKGMQVDKFAMAGAGGGSGAAGGLCMTIDDVLTSFEESADALFGGKAEEFGGGMEVGFGFGSGCEGGMAGSDLMQEDGSMPLIICPDVSSPGMASSQNSSYESGSNIITDDADNLWDQLFAEEPAMASSPGTADAFLPPTPSTRYGPPAAPTSPASAPAALAPAATGSPFPLPAFVPAPAPLQAHVSSPSSPAKRSWEAASIACGRIEQDVSSAPSGSNKRQMVAPGVASAPATAIQKAPAFSSPVPSLCIPKSEPLEVPPPLVSPHGKAASKAKPQRRASVKSKAAAAAAVPSAPALGLAESPNFPSAASPSSPIRPPSTPAGREACTPPIVSRMLSLPTHLTMPLASPTAPISPSKPFSTFTPSPLSNTSSLSTLTPPTPSPAPCPAPLLTAKSDPSVSLSQPAVPTIASDCIRRVISPEAAEAVEKYKTRQNQRQRRGVAMDSQSVAARKRRERISQRLKNLQAFVPGSKKLDMASMLGQTMQYIRFLEQQVHKLAEEKGGLILDEFLSGSGNQSSPNLSSVNSSCGAGSDESDHSFEDLEL